MLKRENQMEKITNCANYAWNSDKKYIFKRMWKNI